MDKYFTPLKQSIKSAKPSRRYRWKRSSIELNGRLEPNYRHEMSGLLIHSYSEVGAFPHLYHINGVPCQSHMHRLASEANISPQMPFRKQGISAVDFDNKGIYLVSATKLGCLTVHDFETLYCQIHDLACLEEDESKHVLHISLNRQLNAVRWNPINQDEVVCTSTKHNEVAILDVGYVSSEPVDVLRTRRVFTVNGTSIYRGLADIAFMKNDSRILASDTHGVVNVWDRRSNALPCLELTSGSTGTLNSIQLNADNQLIFGAGKHGSVYMWDIRGGRGAATFQNHRETCYPPVMSLKLASLLENINSLKAQTDIFPKEIHSINLNPSCPYQLAFHLDDGWSGVLDIYTFQVTHIHCPPPAWLNDSNTSVDLLYTRKPSWLSTSSDCDRASKPKLRIVNLHNQDCTMYDEKMSQIPHSQRIYVVGSSSHYGVHVLDFHPTTSSPSHVDYKCDDKQGFSPVDSQTSQNRFLPLSEGVTSCAAHPLNNTVIVGTQGASLLMISQRYKSCKGDG